MAGRARVSFELRRASGWTIAALLSLASCKSGRTASEQADATGGVALGANDASAPVRDTADGAAAGPASQGDSGADTRADAAASSELPGRTEGCPERMVRVEGEYCPAVIQDCEEHHPEYLARKNEKTVSERCLKYKRPTKCMSKQRQHLAFCMDRYEWPNQVGELPRVLTSWLEAKSLCEKAGKRLCSEDEHNFACEGPEALPYAVGYDRDPQKCNIDKPYVQPDQSTRLPTYDKCDDDPHCKSEMKRLDRRHAIGSTHTCVSWAGIVDINGNVNEWVEIPGEKHPNRSGLKGGWWGPVRNRCRPTVTFHKEFDYGYEAGFRCCKDLAPTGTGTDGN